MSLARTGRTATALRRGISLSPLNASLGRLRPQTVLLHEHRPHAKRPFNTSAAVQTTSTDVQKKLAQQKEKYERELQEGKDFLVEKGYDLESMHVQPIVWGDHDAFRHVNNVNYLKFMESGRMNFAARLADHLPAERAKDVISGTGKSFILAGANIRYKRPVVYPDTLIIAQAIVLPMSASRDRFLLRGAAYSLAQKTIVCTCDQDCVSYDYTALRKAPLEDDLHALLEAKGMRE